MLPSSALFMVASFPLGNFSYSSGHTDHISKSENESKTFLSISLNAKNSWQHEQLFHFKTTFVCSLPTLKKHWASEIVLLPKIGNILSLYHWPPVWLVWNQLYDNWQFLFLFAKHTNTNQSNRRSTVECYFPL